jgi:hypothetical protein
MALKLNIEYKTGEKKLITDNLNMTQLKSLTEHIEKGRIAEFSKIEIINNKN